MEKILFLTLLFLNSELHCQYKQVQKSVYDTGSSTATWIWAGNFLIGTSTSPTYNVVIRGTGTVESKDLRSQRVVASSGIWFSDGSNLTSASKISGVGASVGDVYKFFGSSVSWGADISGGGGGGLAGISSCTATLLIAASGSTAHTKSIANYVCAGTGANDQVVINSAISSISSVGGRVLLSEGTFYIKAPIVINSSGVCLSGLGFNTIILATANIPSNMQMVYLQGSHNKIDNLTIDGNKGNNSYNISGVLIESAKNFVIQNTQVRNLNYRGIVTPISTPFLSFFGTINNCLLKDINNYTMYIFSLSSSTISNNVFSNTIGAILIDTGYSMTIANNNITGINTYGVYINNVCNSTVVSNLIKNTSGSGTGIHLDANCNNNSILSNTISNSNIGIWICSSSNNNNWVCGNYAYSCTYIFTNIGTGTIVGSNSWTP